MTKHKNLPNVPLPRGWRRRVKSTMPHVVSLAQYAVAYSRGWAVNSAVARVRLKAENEQLRQYVALLTEEIRIKDARMKRIAAPSAHIICLPSGCPFLSCGPHGLGPFSKQLMRSL